MCLQNDNFQLPNTEKSWENISHSMRQVIMASTAVIFAKESMVEEKREPPTRIANACLEVFNILTECKASNFKKIWGIR
jgi:hypothetical protein